MKQLPHLVIAGSIAVDRIMNFTGRYADYIRPEAADSLSISIFLESMTDAPGGVGANIAYSLAMLGEKPALLGSFGKESAAYMERLARAGVNTTYLHESALPTAAFNVITDSDQNQVGGFYPGAMFDSASLSLEPWKRKASIVVVAPHDPAGMRTQVQQCKEWQLRLVYDVGQQVSNLEAADLLAGVEAAEVLIVNEYELGALAAKISWSPQQLLSRVPVVVTTLGAAGSRVEGSRVPRPVTVGVVTPTVQADPTGAGDAYRAGFLYGLRRGWNWAVCAQLGATTAAYALEHTGTQAHEFNIKTVTARYKATFGVGLPTTY